MAYGKMIELERTFLAKSLPEGMKNPKEMSDLYIPVDSRHPVIRIRKNGDKLVMTKKEPVDNDPSHQEEHNIYLTQEEFDALIKLEGKKVEKLRYELDYNGRNAEVDVFQGALKGLVLIDFEFETKEEKDDFEMPDFCLVDITPEEFIAGGMVCGKSYEDLEADLARFNYQKII